MNLSKEMLYSASNTILRYIFTFIVKGKKSTPTYLVFVLCSTNCAPSSQTDPVKYNPEFIYIHIKHYTVTPAG